VIALGSDHAHAQQRGHARDLGAIAPSPRIPSGASMWIYPATALLVRSPHDTGEVLGL
jgi:hypothetical protein